MSGGTSTKIEKVGDVQIESQYDAQFPNSVLRIITGPSKDEVLLAAERLSSEAALATFGELQTNRETGDFRVIGMTTGSLKKSYVGTAVGLAVAAMAMFFVMQAEARPKKPERTCESYSWCLDWKKSRFFKERSR